MWLFAWPDESFGGEKMRRRKSCSDRDDLSGRVLLYIATFSQSKQTSFLSLC
jgi:hypothetical protein